LQAQHGDAGVGGQDTGNGAGPFGVIVGEKDFQTAAPR